nr:AHH domain-containing protein [Photorhabdus akhurstii]
MARHQGNHNDYSRAIKNALDKIDLNQSVSFQGDYNYVVR